MSWLTELAKVYDNTIGNDDLADRPAPIFHTANNASVTVTLDGDGNFIKAEKIVRDKESSDHVTVMPCTESCSNRTSGADAYPLCDKLEYLAEDDKKFGLYRSLLGAWAESEFANKKIRAVFAYISSRTLLSDLEKSKIAREDVGEFVRWRVEVPGDMNPELWDDEETQRSWIDFYNSESFDDYCRKNFSGKDAEKRIRRFGLDYADGTAAKIASYHPGKIRSAASSAKIISSNDTTNFTFRGRFLTDGEAVQISSETTQKAHSALRWLIKRQGVSLDFRTRKKSSAPPPTTAPSAWVSLDSRTRKKSSACIGDGLAVVSWNRAGEDFPPLVCSSADFSDSGEDFGFDDDEPPRYSTAREFSDALNKRLRGYYCKAGDPQKIMVMAIKEATPGQGRTSIILYREIQNTDLLDSLEKWHDRLSWRCTYWTGGKKEKGEKARLVRTIGSPSPETIAKCAYGERVKPALVEKTVQRLLPCILDGGLIPRDLETQCVKSASNLLAIIEKNKDGSVNKEATKISRDTVLETACAVYKYNHEKEGYQVALEENRTSRDYLFGRLLAVADKIESSALWKRAKREDPDRKGIKIRETNAVRYMQAFSVRPSSTWKNLFLKVLPYKNEVDSSYFATITDITAKFDAEEYKKDTPLTGEFLLGYQCQLKALWKKSGDSSPADTEE